MATWIGGKNKSRDDEDAIPKDDGDALSKDDGDVTQMANGSMGKWIRTMMFNGNLAMLNSLQAIDKFPIDADGPQLL